MDVRSALLPRALALLALALPFVPSAAHAARSYDNCTGFIGSVPAVITSPGTWCLRKDLATSLSDGVAIAVKANNVTIDCNDFKLGRLGAGRWNLASGIAAEERQNITVRNCNVRGFSTGISLAGSASGGHLLEYNRVANSTNYGVWVEGDGSTIRSNRLTNIGHPVSGNYTDLVAIAAAGSVDVLDNLVAGVVAPTESANSVSGIMTWGWGSSAIRGNRVRGLRPGREGVAWAIVPFVGALVRDNHLQGPGHANATAINCQAGQEPSLVRGNAIQGFGVPMSNCVDGGGNVALP